MEYHITQYDLEQGALEIQYIEEYFGEFPRKKTAVEIVRRLQGRAHLILLATAPLPDDPGTVVPVSFKVAHEIKTPETEAKLDDLVHRLGDYVQFGGRRVLLVMLAIVVVAAIPAVVVPILWSRGKPPKLEQMGSIPPFMVDTENRDIPAPNVTLSM